MTAPRAEAVAIVTGGSSEFGGDVARTLAGRGFTIVVVYLDDQDRADATVDAVFAAGSAAVAVRADLADDLDVQRLFAESIAAFGGVDVVVHTMAGRAVLLYEHAARHVRERGAIVSVSTAERIAPDIARRMRERGITVDRAPPEAVLPFLDQWRRAIG